MIRIGLVLAALSLGGCATADHSVEVIRDVFGTNQAYGYKEYDPCIRCGEGWIFLPNPSHEAQLENWKKENQKHLTK